MYLSFPYSLTCTVDSISLETSNAGTFKTTKRVIAGGFFMTVIDFYFTFIDVYKNKESYIIASSYAAVYNHYWF